MNGRFLVLAVLLLGGVQTGYATDRAVPSIVIPDSMLRFDGELSAPRRYNPLSAVGLSALLPGAGQLYCSQPLRSGLFLTAEVTMGLVAINRYGVYHQEAENVSHLSATTGWYRRMIRTTPADSLDEGIALAFEDYRIQTMLARHYRDEAKYGMYHSVGWLTGTYLWNILNALECSKHFYDDAPRVPARAAWLSAIPALGLGQLYNGAFSKAGMIWTVQTMLAIQAYNYNRLMTKAIEGQREAAAHEELAAYESRFLGRYDEALRKRNMYLWYGIFFYLYGIFDAAVDAHLHDYRHKIRLEPVVDTNTDAVGMNLRMDF
jgi:hypothetical protein